MLLSVSGRRNQLLERQPAVLVVGDGRHDQHPDPAGVLVGGGRDGPDPGRFGRGLLGQLLVVFGGHRPAQRAHDDRPADLGFLDVLAVDAAGRRDSGSRPGRRTGSSSGTPGSRFGRRCPGVRRRCGSGADAGRRLWLARRRTPPAGRRACARPGPSSTSPATAVEDEMAVVGLALGKVRHLHPFAASPPPRRRPPGRRARPRAPPASGPPGSAARGRLRTAR